MTNPCCERCAERLGGSGGGFLSNCANFACECHKSAGKCNCDGLETEGKHYKSCPAFAPTDTSEEWKAGHAAALSKVKELAEGMKKPYEHHFGVGADSVVMAHNNALTDLLDHLKTIE